MFKILKLIFIGLKERLIIDEISRKFIIFNKNKWYNNKIKFNNNNRNIILVDKFTWNPWIYYFSYITNYLSSKTNSRIEYFYFPLKPNWLDIFFISDRRLNAIYKSFGCKKGITSLNLSHFYESNHTGNLLFKNINNKADLLKITYKSILIGDLVYDTYLRNTSKATVDINDPYLKSILIRAIKIVLICEKYFFLKKVIAIIPSHNVYTSFGIIVRLGSLYNIPSFRINSRQRGMSQFKLIQISPPFHLGVNPYYDYKFIFNQLDSIEKQIGVNMGTKLLIDRLSGNIDAGIHYMKNSSFKKELVSKVFKNNGKANIVLLLHCFLDSPHRYRNILFTDFYEWVCYTLEESKKTDFNWYVKPHPNGLPGNNKIINDLKLKFPNITFLEDDVSNLQLVKEKVSSIFTVFGTAGHEFAYLGIPVVNAGDNPHIGFDFNFNPVNIEDYQELIYKAGNLNIKINKNEVASFAFMHYLFYDNIDKKSNDVNILDSDFINHELGINQYSKEIYNYFILNDSKDKNERIFGYIDYFFRNIKY